jgi:CRISPR-associated protein Csb1
MPIDWKKLDDSPRILIEAKLKPVAGSRIQPTGFPDLGPATYDAPDGNGGTIATLLVESAQSMANRLEAVCWDEATEDIAAELKGFPYIKVKLAGLPGDENTTNSLLEFHRLNSPYIMTGMTKDGTAFEPAQRACCSRTTGLPP